MKTISKILYYLDSVQGKKHKKMIYFFQDLFLPIFLIIEYICYIKIWKKIVIPELLTNDEIVGFLDRNEFGLKKYMLWKKELIEKDSILDTFNPEEAEFAIQSEVVNGFTEIIEKHTNVDIENYITLNVKIDIESYDDTSKRHKIYTIKIMYYRYPEIMLKKKYLIWWCIGVALIFFGIKYSLVFLPTLF